MRGGRSLARWTAVCLLFVALASLLGWTFPLSRHYLLRLVTLVEFGLTRTAAAEVLPFHSSGESEVPVFIHAARAERGALANASASVRDAIGRYGRVEVDVSFSSDLVPYLSHGDDLTVLTGRPMGPFESYSSGELDRLTLRDGTPPLRLSIFMAEWAPRAERVFLDVKSTHARAREKAVRLLGALPAVLRPKVQLISTCGSLLTWVKREAVELEVGCETYGPIANWLAGFEVFSTSGHVVNARRDGIARQLRLERVYWTAYTEAEYRQLVRWKPEAVLVDLSGDSAPAVPASWLRGVQ